MLLDEHDPHPVEIIGRDRESSGLLVCEHAGRLIPRRLKTLGLPDSDLQRHIAYDIGAKATAILVAEILNAPLVLQHYSRLVIDCNRPPAAPDSIPTISDNTLIEGNRNLDQIERDERVNEIFNPYDHTVTHLLAEHQYRWAFSIHSFNPRLNGVDRPWDIGLLFRHDTNTSKTMAEYAELSLPECTLGLNQPYQIDDESDWFVPQHAERLNLQHSLIEIRNDHITTVDGQQKWAAIVADLIRNTVKI